MKRTTTIVSAALVTMLALTGCGQSETSTAPAPDAATKASPATVAPAAAAVAPTQAATTANLATSADAALAAMQGEWISVEDPRATLSITRNEVVMGYTGDSESSAPMRLDFVRECEGRVISGPRLAFTLTDADMVLCYAELEVDADNLEYFYLPRGNRQAFRRAPSPGVTAH